MAKSKAFSFIETSITLAIVVICLAFSVPSLKKLYYKYQLEATATILQDAIELTRSTAIAHNRPCYLEPDNRQLNIYFLENNQKTVLYSINLTTKLALSYRAAGSGKLLKFNQKGMTYNNARFTITSNIASLELYLNKAGRSYYKIK